MVKINFVKILLSLIIFNFLILGKEVGKERLKGVSIVELLSIGSEDSDVLYMWAWLATDPEGNIYVTDSMDYSIKKFDARGRLIKKAGKKGQGPGEFLAPRLIEYNKGLLYVNDERIPGIQIFDNDLNYKGHIPIKMPIAHFKVLSNDRLAISTIPTKKSAAILVFDFHGDLKEEIKYLEEFSNPFLGLVRFEIDKKENLYLIFNFQDKIEKLDKRGNKLWNKTLFGEKKAIFKKSKVSDLPKEVFYKNVIFDIYGNLFILGGSFSKNRSRDVYVLDKDGNYLTTFTLPESTHCIHIDSKNNLYSRAGMGTTLKKYSLKYQFN